MAGLEAEGFSLRPWRANWRMDGVLAHQQHDHAVDACCVEIVRTAPKSAVPSGT